MSSVACGMAASPSDENDVLAMESIVFGASPPPLPWCRPSSNLDEERHGMSLDARRTTCSGQFAREATGTVVKRAQKERARGHVSATKGWMRVKSADGSAAAN